MNAWRKTLLITLSVTLFFEVAFTIAAFMAPHLLLQRTGLAANPDTLFLAFALAWCLILISCACGLALHWTYQRNASAPLLVNILGFWWIAIGIAIFLKSGKIENLFTDSLKGLLIVLFSALERKSANGSPTAAHSR